MSYESPVTLIHDVANQVNADIENRIYQAVIKIGIDVNKEELIKALKYDRNQYEKGYNDATTHAHWIDYDGKLVELDPNGCPKDSCWCSHCREWLVASDEYTVFGKYCPNCGAKMDEEENT